MLGYRSLVSSVLFASTLGLGAVSPAYAGWDCGFHGEMGRQRAERMEQHHQRLHDAMKLTPEQEGAWKKLLASEQPMAKAEGSGREDWAKLTAPERAERMLEHMKAREARMAEHVAALKEFYAVLTPAQQKTFDEFHAGPRSGMRWKPGSGSPGAGAPPKS